MLSTYTDVSVRAGMNRQFMWHLIYLEESAQDSDAIQSPTRKSGKNIHCSVPVNKQI